MRVAVIDVGTNTVRLLVGEADGTGGYRSVLAAQEITRLGQGMLPNDELQPEPMQRTLVVLDRFRRAAESQQAVEIAVVGTSALRRARNREVFLSRARREAGLEILMISGEEEARLTLKGVCAAVAPGQSRFLMMDVGGGSTELALARGGQIQTSLSLGLGAVTLTETHLRTDPPLPDELAAVREAVQTGFARLPQRLLGFRAGQEAESVALVGTAGTITTLAAIDLSLSAYDPARVNGHRLSRAGVEVLLGKLATLPLTQRRQVRGLEPARADIIVAGGIICLGAMEGLDFTEMTVSDGGLREGVLLDLLRQSAGTPPPETGH